MAGRPSVRVRALVLARTKLAEQDLILTLLAQDGTQMRAVAKGARKPGGRLASRVELFCETDFLIAQGRTLGIITEAQLVDAHAGLRGSLEKVSSASAICEMARLTCYEGMSDSFVYPLCARTLRACEEAHDQAHLDLVVAAYAFKVLSHEGWRPELVSCIACGDPQTSFFSTAMGGMLCSSCAKDVGGAQELSNTEVNWLRALIGLTFDQLLAAQIESELAALLLSLAHNWGVVHLDTRLRSWEFIMNV